MRVTDKQERNGNKRKMNDKGQNTESIGDGRERRTGPPWEKRPD